jgi:hypothetical protein
MENALPITNGSGWGRRRPLGEPEAGQRGAPGVLTRRGEANLCIPCAMTNHTFNQRIATPSMEGFHEEQMPWAWIDGRSYRLVYRPPQRIRACTECGEAVHIAYELEG